MSTADDFEQRLQSFTGVETSPSRPGPDPVNTPMIRHWTEAIGGPSALHLDDGEARATGRDGAVAPATMAQVWTMPGYAATCARDAGERAPGPAADLEALLTEGGYTSVVATDSAFDFVRELRPGDRVSVSERVESVSAEKRTALGTGRFLTTVRTYTDAGGETVATQRWRLLRFRPGTGRGTGDEAAEKPGRAPRPRPALNRDNTFWFDAARERRLVIQRCTGCGTLRHPPGPCCGDCGSYEWDTVQAAGRATVYSYTVNHHPRHPAFDYPLVVAVVELAEGTRLITGLTGVAPDEVHIGMPVTVEWAEEEDGPTLPVFRPAPQEES